MFFKIELRRFVSFYYTHFCVLLHLHDRSTTRTASLISLCILEIASARFHGRESLIVVRDALQSNPRRLLFFSPRNFGEIIRDSSEYSNACINSCECSRAFANLHVLAKQLSVSFILFPYLLICRILKQSG